MRLCGWHGPGGEVVRLRCGVRTRASRWQHAALPRRCSSRPPEARAARKDGGGGAISPPSLRGGARLSRPKHSHLMKLQPVTVFMGIGLMDRFLTQGYMKGLRNLQLLGIACITLATRIEENQPYNSVLQKTFKVGINTYSRSEVVAMEWLVQEVLNFKCFVTTTHHFLWFYLKAAKADDRVADLAKYLSLLSLLNHEQLSFWPSTVAAAVVALACLATDKQSSCHLVMETHMRTQDDDLPECLMSLEWMINYASGH